MSTTATQIVLPGKVDPEALQTRERSLPTPDKGQVLIRMEATGVSFAEQQMRRGKYYDQPAFPFVPGYDLVGTVTATGADVDPGLMGQRVAALTKIGAWSTHMILDVDAVVPVPEGVDAADAETVVVNGITAWQMLHRTARVSTGQTILVLGANGGVGSTLVQLARAAGIRVIGTASPRHHEKVAALGAIPLDYRAEDLPAQVRALAPQGVDAVFDHVGGAGIVDSFRLLAPGGALVSYGTAATRDQEGSPRLPVLKLFGRLLVWNVLPNRRRASFFNIWTGVRNSEKFRARLRQDLTEVFTLLTDGTLRPQVAARIPLAEAARAMRLAESGTVTGKVVLVP
ncbi:MAG TPA: medium chain dehydrogenase/reductase family protein [Kutzneria sp.]